MGSVIDDKGTFGSKSRRGTDRTTKPGTNTFKIAKARSMNTISATGANSSFNTRKPVRGMNQKI